MKLKKLLSPVRNTEHYRRRLALAVAIGAILTLVIPYWVIVVAAGTVGYVNYTIQYDHLTR